MFLQLSQKYEQDVVEGSQYQQFPECLFFIGILNDFFIGFPDDCRLGSADRMDRRKPMNTQSLQIFRRSGNKQLVFKESPAKRPQEMVDAETETVVRDGFFRRQQQFRQADTW